MSIFSAAEAQVAGYLMSNPIYIYIYIYICIYIIEIFGDLDKSST